MMSRNTPGKGAGIKPVLEHLPLQPDESFAVRDFDYSHYPTPWHFHPEYELVLVTESTGKRFIGDDISDFGPDNLVLIGAHVPHLYRNDAAYYEPGSSLRAKSIVVHFLERSFGENFFELPEAVHIAALLKEADRGLEIKGNTRDTVAQGMHELCRAQGLNRWMILLKLLHTIAESKEYVPVSGHPVLGHNHADAVRLNEIFNFVMNHFREPISVPEIAAQHGLSENAFSKYFARRTRKTFSAFVNDVRLSHAARLLVSTRQSVTEICFASGFNNVSHFNRQFRQKHQLSPLAYRKAYWHA